MDKGKALLTLAGLLGLGPVSGDGLWRIPSTIWPCCGPRGWAWPWAMHAPEIAAAADVRTACNDEDGVAKAIEWYVLGQKGED